MTIKLFDEDAYLTDFSAVILSMEKEKDVTEIVLDKTGFFPEQGGQTPDRGYLNESPVSDVQIKDEIIYHYVKNEYAENFKVGDTVKGRIDFQHRFSNMQLHSGEHIFSGLVFREYGFNNVGFHLSDNTATMDYDGVLTDEDVLKLETMANEVIVSNKSIFTSYPDEETLKVLNYRSKKELSGPIRIVEIEDTDVCACCAPHVKLTGEIGMLKIINRENHRGGVRITYLCGFRALSFYRDALDTLKYLQNTLSAKPGREKEAIKKLSDDNKELAYRNVGLIQSKLSGDITLLEEPIWIGEKEYAEHLRFIINCMHERFSDTVFAFAGNDEDGYRYLIESDSKDLTEISKLLRERFNAKGGGRKDSIQGSAPLKADDIGFLFNL